MKHLRKSIVISVIALVAMNFPIPIFGQTTIAIQGGMSRATLGGSDVENADARIGITLGASATIPIQDKFSLRLGGNYVQKGAKFGGNIEGFGGGSGNTDVDYIELSGLGVFKLAPSESQASVYMLVGPSVAFKTKCEGSFSGSFFSEDINLSEDCGEDTNSFDFGITGGIGAGMAISEQMTFSVDLLYTLGILSLDDADDVKNRALIIRAGVGFPIGK